MKADDNGSDTYPGITIQQRDIRRQRAHMLDQVRDGADAALRAAERYADAKRRLARLQNECPHPEKRVTQLQQSQDLTECPDCGLYVRD